MRGLGMKPAWYFGGYAKIVGGIGESDHAQCAFKQRASCRRGWRRAGSWRAGAGYAYQGRRAGYGFVHVPQSRRALSAPRMKRSNQPTPNEFEKDRISAIRAVTVGGGGGGHPTRACRPRPRQPMAKNSGKARPRRSSVTVTARIGRGLKHEQPQQHWSPEATGEARS